MQQAPWEMGWGKQPGSLAPRGGGGVIVSTPPDPYKAAQEERANEQLQLSIAANRRAEEQAKRDQAKFESEDTMAPPPGDTSKTGEDYLKTIPPSLAGQVRALSDGRRAFPTGTALRSPAVQQLIAAATQYDPTLDATNAATRVATRKDFTSGKSAQNITALNTVIGHLGSLYQSAQDLHNRGIKPWNTIANAAESATVGFPALKGFNLSRQAVADEMERVWRQAGGNVSEIQGWRDSFSSSSTPDEFRAAVGKAMELLNSRLEALSAQYGQGMGKSVDGITFLKPNAQSIFQHLAPGGDGVLPTSGSDKPPPPALGATGGSGPKPPPGGLGGPGASLATMDPNSKLGVFKQTYRNEYDPDTSAGLNALIHKGASVDQANAYLTGRGFDPISDPGTYAAAVSYAKDHPDYVAAQATKSVPTSIGERLASSPAAAALAGAAAGGTAGFSDTLGRNLLGPEWDANRAALAAIHPVADAVGNVGGGIGAAIAAPELLAKYAPGALGVLARVGTKLGKFAAPAGDFAYGATYGANEDPNDPAGGAAAGGLTALIGGHAGRSATRGLANMIAPPAGQFAPLYEAGGFPTVGQRFGQSGFVGRALNTAEQAMQSMPGLGAMVARARDIPRDAAQIGAFNQALGELKPFAAAGHDVPSALPPGTAPGTAPHAFTAQAFNQAYPIARSGMQMVPGGDYAAATQDFAKKWFPLLNSEQKTQLSDLIKGSVTSRIKAGGGMMNGAAYQQSASDIGDAASAWSRSDPLLAQAASEYGSILDNAARASSNPQAAALLDAADRGYAKYAGVIRPASARVGGDPGEFTMKAFDRAVQNNASGPNGSQYLRGTALMQPYADAIRPLGDVLSNSGTGERLLTNRLFMGEQAAGGAAAAGLGGIGALAAHPGALAPFALYAPGGNMLVTRAIAPRQYVLPTAIADPLNLAGSKINGLAPLVGAGSVPLSLSLYGGPQ